MECRHCGFSFGIPLTPNFIRWTKRGGTRAGAALIYDMCLLSPEAVNGFAVVFFAGPGDGLGPFGMVEGIGVELGLQGNAAALAVINAVLTGFLQEIARVELDTGAVG